MGSHRVIARATYQAFRNTLREVPVCFTAGKTPSDFMVAIVYPYINTLPVWKPPWSTRNAPQRDVTTTGPITCESRPTTEKVTRIIVWLTLEASLLLTCMPLFLNIPKMHRLTRFGQTSAVTRKLFARRYALLHTASAPRIIYMRTNCTLYGAHLPGLFAE